MRPIPSVQTMTRLIVVASLATSVAMAQTPGAADRNRQTTQPGTSQRGLERGQMDQRFVQEAALMGLKEVRLGQIALQSAESSEVKQFAQHMVQDHSQANQKLSDLARSKGIAIPSTNTFMAQSGTSTSDREYVRERDTSRPGVRPNSDTVPATPGSPGAYDRQQQRERQLQGSNPEQERQAIDRLQKLSGTQFDQAYMAEMVKDHAKAVQKFQQASANLQDPELKQFASETLPKLQEHHQMAQQLAAKIGHGQTEGGTLNQNQNQNQNQDQDPGLNPNRPSQPQR